MATIDNQTQNLAGQLNSLLVRLGNQLPTQAWRDLKHNQHDRAFVVAGAMKADLLNDLANAVNDSISKGLGLDYFQKEFDRIVEKHGWAHTGERRWRARVIYGTNMRVSYAAGRLAQLKDPELRAIKPFWMYRHSGSDHPRLQHKAWDKLCLPADDPWFKTHYPPNGWGCGCSVQAVSARDIARIGGRIEKPPEGTDGIDEGWDYQPGADVGNELGNFAGQKAAALPVPISAEIKAIARQLRSESQAITDVVAKGIESGNEHGILVRGGEKIADRMGAIDKVGFTDDEFSQAKKGALVHNHPSGSSFSPADLDIARNRVQTVIAAGHKGEVYRVSVLDKDGLTLRMPDVFDRMITLLNSAKKSGKSENELGYWQQHLLCRLLARDGYIAYSYNVIEPPWLIQMLAGP